MNKKRILIIEDDKAISDIVRDFLAVDGFEVQTCDNGSDGLKAALSENFDLILLDIMLPGMDGFAVCKEIRAKLTVPILLVTARTHDIDKIRGLGLGANDYIEKPFSPAVLVARVKSQIANYQRIAESGGNSAAQIVRATGIALNTQTLRVSANGQEKDLKKKECDLLAFLMQNPERVFSKEELYKKIWGDDTMSGLATVAVHINRLREKIEQNPAEPKIILTVWGAGYRFAG